MLVEAILDAFAEANMLDALQRAGNRLLEHDETEQEYKRWYDTYMNDPKDLAKKEALEEIEELYYGQEEYQTLKEMGRAQPAYLEALDLVDHVGPKMRLYRVCRARTWYDARKDALCSCGLAFPAKMWLHSDKTYGLSVCQVDWEPLGERGEQVPR